MRVIAASLMLVLAAAPPAWAGEKLYVSRTLKLDFRHPGQVSKVGGSGMAGAREQVLKNSYILVLPRAVRMTLSIANDNEDEHHYHIVVRIQDERQLVNKVEAVIVPDDIIRNIWLASYRYEFALLQKHATGQGQFVTALVKIDVYAPREK